MDKSANFDERQEAQRHLIGYVMFIVTVVAVLLSGVLSISQDLVIDPSFLMLVVAISCFGVFSVAIVVAGSFFTPKQQNWRTLAMLLVAVPVYTVMLGLVLIQPWAEPGREVILASGEAIEPFKKNSLHIFMIVWFAEMLIVDLVSAAWLAIQLWKNRREANANQ